MTSSEKPKRKILLDDEELRQDLPVSAIRSDGRYTVMASSGPIVITPPLRRVAGPKGIEFLDFLLGIIANGLANSYAQIDVARRLTSYLVNEAILLGSCVACDAALYSKDVQADGVWQLQRVNCAACSRTHTVEYLRQQATR